MFATFCGKDILIKLSEMAKCIISNFNQLNGNI